MNYILRYTGSLEADAEAVQQVLAKNGIPILDKTALPKMLLVGNIEDNNLPGLKASLPAGWEFFPQQEKYQVPDTRRKEKK